MGIHIGQAPILSYLDILLEILNYLQPGRRSQAQEDTQTRRHRRICRNTLLACSLTCQTLSDLALDVLWRAVDDVQTLLRLLPRVEGRRSGRQMVLKSQITLEAWSKLQSYATRVREIGYSSRPDQVHRSIWTFLEIKCQGAPLFPHLRDLEAEIALDDLSSLFLLLSSSLRSLSLSFINDSWSASPQVTLLALQQIAQMAPQINFFHMSGNRYITEDHVSFLQGFSGLTSLSVGSGFPFNGSMLLRLSTSSSLDTLSISVHQIHSADLQSLNEGFRSLRKLAIKGSLNNLIKCILSSHLSSLDELCLQVIDSHSVSPKQFCHRLALICRHPGIPGSLTRIGCEFYSGVSWKRKDTMTRYLDPFLSFPLVEHCHFTFHHTLPSICDADLTRLGDTWAHLQSLEVKHIPRVRGRYDDPMQPVAAKVQRPTLFGVTELARRCPSLARVHLPELDASTLLRTTTASRLTSVREITFDDVHYVSTSSETPIAVAAVLDIVFPQLNIAKSASMSFSAPIADPDTQPPGLKWRAVLKFVHAMQLGRRHSQLALNMDSDETAVEMDFTMSMTDLDLDVDLGSDVPAPEPRPDDNVNLLFGSQWGMSMEPESDLDSSSQSDESSLAPGLSADSDSDDSDVHPLMQHMMDP